MNARKSHKTSEHEAIRNVVIGQSQRQGLDVSRLKRLNVCFNVKNLLCLNSVDLNSHECKNVAIYRAESYNCKIETLKGDVGRRKE